MTIGNAAKKKVACLLRKEAWQKAHKLQLDKNEHKHSCTRNERKKKIKKKIKKKLKKNYRKGGEEREKKEERNETKKEKYERKGK